MKKVRICYNCKKEEGNQRLLTFKNEQYCIDCYTDVAIEYMNETETADIAATVENLRRSSIKYHIGSGISFGFEMQSELWFVKYGDRVLKDCLTPSEVYSSIFVLLDYMLLMLKKEK
ncbi:hypothetical protein LCGC14_0872580 [marine sediment metagenome]|uniref:Uncharacterized protein n=1 Tax=marine sediment metagenome TaxID=412755 RepID=A0A0F9P464_9ZZZZ